MSVAQADASYCETTAVAHGRMATDNFTRRRAVHMAFAGSQIYGTGAWAMSSWFRILPAGIRGMRRLRCRE